MTSLRNSNPLPPFGDLDEETLFFAKGFLQMVRKPGGDKKFSLLILEGKPETDRQPLQGKTAGIGKRELVRNGIKTLSDLKTYLALEANAGRHVGRKSIERLVTLGRLW